MRLGYTILYVASVADAIVFYEAAFGLERGMVAPTGEYGEQSTGATKLAFSANDFAATLTEVPVATAGPDRQAPPMEIALVTEEVGAAYDRAVAAGAVAVKPPARKPWGQLVAYVRDNNGFLAELCSPLPA